MELNPSILNYIESHQAEALSLLIDLARIPAPSGHEELRAEFCKSWLEKQGAQGVYIDDALNVIYPIGMGDQNPIHVYMAHSDVVFPDTALLPLRVENGRVYCPGVGDDTASVVVLMFIAKYIAETGILPKDRGVMIVINSGEEGLGNLKGCRKIIENFGDRIREFITFDDQNGYGVNRAVGSKRFRIRIETEGGHSFGDFGNRNAIACMAALIGDLYDMKVPEKGKTTFNVGTISGGTSVNTIAQQAEMLYEFRSDEKESLEIMQRHLDAAIAFHRAKGLKVSVDLVGNRPCSSDVPQNRQAFLMARACSSAMRRFGRAIEFGSGSTDCNIPLSRGIPAICVGCYDGSGAHTREEYIEIESLLPGMKFAFDLVMQDF